MASARDARAAAAGEALPTALTSLPQPLAQRIWLALPVNFRARAACVCRAWRDALSNPALWAVLDFSGVPWQRQTRTLLRGAAARAGGRLRELHAHSFDLAVLLEVVGANGASLRRLCYTGPPRFWPGGLDEVATLRALAQAAPLLHSLEPDNFQCSCEEAPALLRAEAPLTALRLIKATVNCDDDMDNRPVDAARLRPFLDALADLTLQPSLEGLLIACADLQAVETSSLLVDSVLARRLRTLKLTLCTLPPAAQLARLIAGGLTELRVSTGPETDLPGGPAWNEEQTAAFAGAVRASTTLMELGFAGSRVLLNMRTADVLLGALISHKSLQSLRLGESARGPDALGPAMAALVAADAPALLALDISGSHDAEAHVFLDETNMAPILDALPRNHHLRGLKLGKVDVSVEFVRERLLPALRANASLRQLVAYCDIESPAVEAVAEAAALVRGRPPVN